MDPFENSTIGCRGAVYSVQGLIGAGRFSRVYQATAAGTGKRVAVKALNNGSTKEAEELAVLNALRGSPVRVRYVHVMDAVRLATGTVCLIMERLGITLHAVLHKIGPLPMSMCRPVVRQIAQGKGSPVSPDNGACRCAGDRTTMSKTLGGGLGPRFCGAPGAHRGRFYCSSRGGGKPFFMAGQI